MFCNICELGHLPQLCNFQIVPVCSWAIKYRIEAAIFTSSSFQTFGNTSHTLKHFSNKISTSKHLQGIKATETFFHYFLVKQVTLIRHQYCPNRELKTPEMLGNNNNFHLVRQKNTILEKSSNFHLPLGSCWSKYLFVRQGNWTRVKHFQKHL